MNTIRRNLKLTAMASLICGMLIFYQMPFNRKIHTQQVKHLQPEIHHLKLNRTGDIMLTTSSKLTITTQHSSCTNILLEGNMKININSTG